MAEHEKRNEPNFNFSPRIRRVLGLIGLGIMSYLAFSAAKVIGTDIGEGKVVLSNYVNVGLPLLLFPNVDRILEKSWGISDKLKDKIRKKFGIDE